MTRFRSTLFLCVSVVSFPSATFAQQDDSPKSDGMLGEIIVTATRREERLQNVPIAVTAMAGQQLEAAGIHNAQQLSQVIPNLRYSQQSIEFTPIIRGAANTAASAGDDSNVPTYVDGAFVAAMSQTAQDLLEVERIEVLRGPQGTLFGRNATGGLINIVTKKPSHDFGGNVVGRVGNYGAAGISGYVTGGLTDQLAVGVSGSYYDDSGYVKDLVRGGRANPRTAYGARLKLLFEPSDGVSFTLAANYTHWKDASQGVFQPVDGNTVSRNPDRGGNPDILVATKPWTIASNYSPLFKGGSKDINFQSNIDLGGVTLSTISSAARYTYDFLADNDASPAQLSSNFSDRHQSAYTQEIKLASNGTGRFTWIAGVFGYLTKASSTIQVGLTPTGPFLLNVHPVVKVRSGAIFGEGTYALTDTLKFTAGFRYTEEKRTFSQTSVGVKLFEVSTSNGSFTPRVILQYIMSDNANVYASYSRGFKSATFNAFGFSPRPVKPETLDSWELGLKSNPSRWLQFNLSTFYYRYKDQQVSSRDPTLGSLVLGNAGASRIFGGELEIVAKVTRELTINASLAYQNGKYTKFGPANTFLPLTDAAGNILGGNELQLIDPTGSQPFRAPRTSGNLMVQYARDFGFGEIGGSANASYSSKIYWDFANTSSSPEYALLNGELFWKPRESTRIGIWVTNLTNVARPAYRSFSVAGTYELLEPPRRFGATIRQDF